MHREGARRDGTLLLFGGALGDFLCLLPGLFALRRRQQGAIAVAAQPAFLELIGHRGFDTLSIDRREIADLFSTGPVADSAIALFSNWAKVHSWIGHGDENFAARLAMVTGGTIHIHRLRGMHQGEHASSYLARCLGLEAAPISVDPPGDAVQWASDLWPQNGLHDSVLIVHPGSGSPAKNWLGMESIARHWRAEFSASVVVLCGPAETSVDVPHQVLIREPSPNRIAALLRKGVAYVGNDSGISHLAGLAGARGVVVFGPSDPDIWRPLGDGLQVIRASTACAACGPERFCTHRLGVDEVWRLLREQTRKPPAP